MESAHAAAEQARRAEAARWFARMRAGDCSLAERRGCRQWRESDPANDAAYAQIELLYGCSAEFGGDPARRAASQALRASSARRARRSRIGRWMLGTSAAAVLVLAAGTGWRNWDPVQWEQTYATQVGHQRSVILADGSRLLLDTDSSVQVRYSRKRRQVVLERGQSQFTVATEPGRPFVVQAEQVAVRAVGTQFQVRRDPTGVQVKLLEGVVEVGMPAERPGGAQRLARLAPGEQLSFDLHGQWAKRPLDQEIAAGWPRGELVFRETPLAQLVDEMNRYTQVKIRLADDALGDIRLSGVFYGSDQQTLVQALREVWALRVDRQGSELVVRR